MAVLIVCDVCDDTFRQEEWAGLRMTIPPEMLDLAEDRDEETYTICSWECVHRLASNAVGVPDNVDEPVGYVPADPLPTDAVVEAVKKFDEPQHGEVMESGIVWGNNPLELRVQPTDEVPVGEITRDRRQVTLRRAR